MRINLRDFYPWYTSDEFLEVPDAIAEELLADQRYHKAHWRRMRRNKALYSLDADNGIENEACYINMTLHEIMEHEFLRCHVCQALNSLPEVQGRRVEAHFLLGMSQQAIADSEGVAHSRISESIKRGLRNMKAYLANALDEEDVADRK
jgi:RNA polymerase sigma-70 factor (ECF subfamily)